LGAAADLACPQASATSPWFCHHYGITSSITLRESLNTPCKGGFLITSRRHRAMDDQQPQPDPRLLVVWDVESENRSASGVTRSPYVARQAMLAALNEMPSGRGRVRYAWLTMTGVYKYGAVLYEARRKPGQNGVTLRKGM
jgi:hypothetical protein